MEINNIEALFVEKYNELVRENEKLREVLSLYEDDGLGIHVGGTLDMVRISVQPQWVLDNHFNVKTADEVEAMKAEVDHADEWDTTFGKAIKVERETFPFGFCVVTLRGTKSYASDADGIVVRVDDSTVGAWCPEVQFDEVHAKAELELLCKMDIIIESKRAVECSEA